MKNTLLILGIFIVSFFGGIIGSLYSHIFQLPILHDGIYEMRFGNGQTHKFVVYNDRLHLVVPLPVTSDSSTIDIIKTKKKSKK